MDTSRVRRRARIGLVAGLALGTVFVLLRTPDTDGEQRAAHAAVPAPRIVPASPAAFAPRPLEALLETASAAATTPDDGAPVWSIPAAQIDPDLAAVEGDRLVQVLDDGTRVVLTLDPMLQRAATRALEKFKVEYGAVVAFRPQTGEVLALAEHAELRPDLRRLALQAEGPAASIFKVITAAALLEYGGLNPDDTICVHGGLRGVSLEHLNPDARRDKRCETFTEALGSSNNVAFARWADRLLTPHQLQAMSERFLFNRRVPFLWGTAVSRVRIPASSRVGFARSAAGFEGSALSPLHAALVVAAIGNDGRMMAPRLVAHAERDGQTLYDQAPAVIAEPITPELARQLREMMVSTTTDGTAKAFFHKSGKPRLPGIAVAGKTGSLAARDTGVARHYSWFVALAPADDPQIAIASLVVNGEEWTVKGTVPARDVLIAYFQDRRDGSK